MSKKLNQFYIFKFTSDRLKQSNYNIKLTIQEARQNGELIAQGDNAVIRSIFRIRNRFFDPDQLLGLRTERKRIAKLNADRDTKRQLADLEKQIDDALFVPELISIVVADNRHYKRIVQNGLWINGKRFVRLLCGAGNARRNTVIMCDEEIFEQLTAILDNGRKQDVELVPAKYTAYFSLVNSAGYSVSFPRMFVAPDALINKVVRVDWVDPDSGKIEPEQKELEFNLFDGQGLVHPDRAMQWARDLGLDWMPSSFIIRAPFLKGMVATFDFRAFAHEVAKCQTLIDVWGQEHNVDEIDLIVSQSQFKLWNSYSSLETYLDQCTANELGFSVSRYAPKEDKTTVRSNYQYIQALALSDQDIKSLCQKTVEFFDYAIVDDWRYAFLYLVGDGASDTSNPDWFDKVRDPIVKSLVLNNGILNDPYVRSHLIKSLNKRMKEAALGKLIMDGNYQMAIADPYAQCEHIFGLPIRGLLPFEHHYSRFWIERDSWEVAACRAPLTWVSEVNVLSLLNDFNTEYWYQHLTSGIVYNIHGIDPMLHADSDFDGDLIFTTDQPEFIMGAQGGLPISYAKRSAPKFLIDKNSLWESDLKGFHSRVGFITNVSTSMYAMLPMFDKDTAEHQEIIRRLKFSRFLQGSEIDSAKGLEKFPMPKEWVNWTKADGELDPQHARFLNNILVERRPYFFRYLYPNYNRRYKRFMDRYELICQTKLGIGIQELLQKAQADLTMQEEEIVTNFHRYCPLFDTSSIMNKISHYIEDAIGGLKVKAKDVSFNYSLLIDNRFPINPNKVARMKALWDEYKAHQRSGFSDKEAGSKVQFLRYMRLQANKISTNAAELVNLCVVLLYEQNPKSSKSFLWEVFGDDLVENVMRNKQESVAIPIMDTQGRLEYLGKQFSERRLLL